MPRFRQTWENCEDFYRSPCRSWVPTFFFFNKISKCKKKLISRVNLNLRNSVLWSMKERKRKKNYFRKIYFRRKWFFSDYKSRITRIASWLNGLDNGRLIFIWSESFRQRGEGERGGWQIRSDRTDKQSTSKVTCALEGRFIDGSLNPYISYRETCPDEARARS